MNNALALGMVVAMFWAGSGFIPLWAAIMICGWAIWELCS